jgi:creatinine amidohydrolase/Fe(II)-dependent formamide hydrolase-like protein
MKKTLVLVVSLIYTGIIVGQYIHPYDPVSLPANLENMRAGQILDAVAKGFKVILPIGTLEGTDNDVPVGLYSKELQQALDSLSLKNNAIIAPTIWYSPSGYLMGAPSDGNFDLPTDAFVKYLDEVINEFYNMGFKHVHVVIIHNLLGENSPLVKACRFVLGNIFNDYWKEETIGAGWWLNPEKDQFNRTSLEILSLNSENHSLKNVSPSGRLEEMTPAEIRKAASQGLICIVPVGVIECHGNQNPVGVDIIMVQEPLLMVPAKIPVVIAPAVSYGGTAYAVSGPELGTMNITGQTDYDYNLGIARGLLAMGFKHIIFCSGHQGGGSQSTGLDLVAQEASRTITQQNGYGWMNHRKNSEKLYPVVEYIIHPTSVGDHAGKYETSYMLYLRQSYTRLDLINPNDYPFCWQKGIESINATYELGKQLTNEVVDNWVKIIKERMVYIKK